MEVHNRVSMCDITTFVGGLLEEKEQGERNGHSTRNIGKGVYNSVTRKNYKEDEIKGDCSDSEDNSHTPKLRKRFKEDDTEEDVTANESDDSEEKPFKDKLRKRVRKEMYIFAYDDAQSEDESQTRKGKDRFSRIEDSGDEDYDPDEVSDDDSYKVGYNTKKGKGRFSCSEDSNDDEYDPYKVGYNTKKLKEKKKTKADQNLTEYERSIQKNREEKMAFLKSLKFDEVKESLSDAVKSLKEKCKPVKRPYKPKPFLPLRKKSLRVLAQREVDLSEEALAARVEAVSNKAMQKKLPEILPFEKTLQGQYSFEDFNKEYGDLDHGPKKPFTEHVSHLDTMQLPISQIAKVVGSKITSLTFHPMTENILLAASSGYGQVAFWKVNSDQDSFVFVPHTESITHLKFNPELPQLIVSSSYDGTLRCGDLEKAVFSEAYNVSEETGCTYFDFLSHRTFLVAQRNGIVSVVDHREKLSRACKQHKCHDVLVKTVSIHPLDKSYFLSAGSRGTIKLWDLRKLQKQPIVEVQHHKRCVQSAFFSTFTGKHVLTTSTDDSICLFDSSNLGKSLLLQHSMKHIYEGSKSTWLPNTDCAFLVGGSKDQRKIEIYNDEMDNIYNLAHENLDMLTCTNIFHPSLPVMAGSGHWSGRVFVFSSEGV